MSTDAELHKLGLAYLRAGGHAETARLALQVAIRAAAPTMSEAAIARAAGVTRMTVRKALGK